MHGYTTSDDSEAAYLESQSDEGASDFNRFSMDKINLFKKRYSVAKTKKVNEIFACSCCGKNKLKKQYSQAFCSKKCKDTYWNTVDDSRRIRASLFK